MLVSHNATVYRIGIDEMSNNKDMNLWLVQNGLSNLDYNTGWFIVIFDKGDPREQEFRKLFIEDNDA